MKKKYDVSVIICTYNPQWKKLKSTLLSALEQKNIDFEIVVADDGSKDNCFDWIIDLFKEYKFADYKLVDNKINKGTVENYYSALEVAEGFYSYVISPGDMFYDSSVIHKLYNFAIRNKALICFGNVVYYNADNNSIKVFYDIKNAPSRPWFFDSDLPVEKIKEYFFMGNQINGASFFRKTEVAIKYVGKIRGISKYVEDNTTTAIALVDGVRIWHFNDFTTWYEYGTGVSTSKDESWKKLLEDDFNKVNTMLLKEYPKDKTIRHLIKINSINKEFPKYLYMLFNCPDMIFKRKVFKIQNVSIGYDSPIDESLLMKYLRMGEV